MRLGTRITLSTATLVIVALGVYGFISVRIRRNELAADLERQTQSLGGALQVALEAAAHRRARVATAIDRQPEPMGSGLATALREALATDDLDNLVQRIRANEPSLRIVYTDLATAHPPPAAAPTPDGSASGLGAVAAAPPLADDDDPPLPPDPTRDGRLRHVKITGAAWGEHVEIEDRPVYAYTVPIRDDQESVIGALDIVRDESEAERELAATQRNVAITVLLVSAVLGLLVWLTTRGGISQPLARLVEGIDEVSHGDLTRVILREREDEIGDLAERFNEMTASLRDARVETQRGVEAKLALEARLRHSEKLATIGQLAAGIAHEVGTPLNVIGGRARALEKKAARSTETPTDGDTSTVLEPAEVAKNASIIAAQAARITKIIQQLLDYARKKVSERGPIDLAHVIKDSLDFLEHQLASSSVGARVASFQRDPGDDVPDGPVVLGDADQLQQVCLNLCLNGIQAMSSGGSMEIAIRGSCRRKPGLDMAPPGRYVVLEVADTGVGIPAEDRERIFEPFYSTKQDGGGTGLGLAVSQGIVKDHDGWIEIEGRPQGGTVFRVFLPAFDDRPTQEPADNDSGSFPVTAEKHGPI